MASVKKINGRTQLIQADRLGGINEALLVDEAINKGTFDALEERVEDLETGSIGVTEIKTGDGTVAAPSHTFTSDEDTGLYRIGANNMGVAANGAKVLDIGTSGLGVTGNITTTTPNVYDGATTITAFATGGQADATQITAEYNEITVCATAGDSVKLPTAVLGMNIWIKNAGANYADVFPATGGNIDGGSANAAIRLQPGHEIKFKANSTTAWVSNNPASFIVAQATDITTTVVANAIKGVITTQAATAGASGATPNQFTVTNSFCQADSHVAVYVMTFAGTGNPAVSVVSRADGSFVIQLSSFSAAALNGAHVIGFEIKN